MVMVLSKTARARRLIGGLPNFERNARLVPVLALALGVCSTAATADELSKLKQQLANLQTAAGMFWTRARRPHPPAQISPLRTS